MPSLFLSYRRSDSPDTVKLIHERLKKRLPRWEIFYDHDSIPLGGQFPERLREKVSSAAVVLVIIGPRWLEILRERRTAAVDHVRVEVGLALESGATVVPILVGRAGMPADVDLADFADLKPLLQLNGQMVRPDPDFNGDLEPVISHLKHLDSGEAIGSTLADKYTLTAEIGHGGMGVVYAAQQKAPVKRTVAVKLIKPGMDSRDVLARFDAERQALAVMDHPNIAKVLDAGISDSGRPFFVMEHVKGVPITHYCDDKKMSPRDRLELFILVCNAVQHAHQKGIIHRDLKPSNVLVECVDGKPVPKVIDFGLAKALGYQLTDKTLHTALETRVGTLEYSAPEQAAGRSFDVDTRSDIYSLGVLLYELLTGAPPFTHEDLLKIGEEEMRRVIREMEPVKPSKKLSSSGELPAIAANRHLEPKKLTRTVQGELDWIVMKCLEKERARRYDTANQLGDELQRFLADEPVRAGPPSVSYRAKKYLRRHKASMVTAALVALCCCVFAAVSVCIHLRTRATELTRGLLDAEISRVPEKIDDLDAICRFWADPLLRQAKSSDNEALRLRASLALLPVDWAEVEYLGERLLDAEPGELRVISRALEQHKKGLTERYWAVVEKPLAGKERQRLRAAAALAVFDPDGQRWERSIDPIADDLISVNVVFLEQWSKAFEPVKGRLLPPLAAAFRDRSFNRAAERMIATSLLANWWAANVQVLAELLLDADESQFPQIYAKFEAHGVLGIHRLTNEIDRALPPTAAQEKNERLAMRQANAAVALLKLNQPANVWPLLRQSHDPSVRSYIVNHYGPFGGDARVVVKRLAQESDEVAIQRALVLMLGEFDEKKWPEDERADLLARMKRLFCTAEDPGLHGAAEWLLRKWNQEAWMTSMNDQWKSQGAPGPRIKPELRWHVNGQGQTMAVIPAPVDYRSKAPVHMAGCFAVGTRHVTVEQFLRFCKEDAGEVGREYVPNREYVPTDDCPVNKVDWHEAAAYCNWLSKEEGIDEAQWCYEPGTTAKKMKLRKDFLALTGYRLPTGAEMQFACAAGATTSRFYGESLAIAGKYAWYDRNSKDRTHPGGLLKPNDFGLFDVHGNLWCWCEGVVTGHGPEERQFHGGSFSDVALRLRCDSLKTRGVSNGSDYVGFRVAKTISLQ